MTIKFYLRTSRKPGFKCRVMCRITIDRKKTEFATDFEVLESEWNTQKQRPIKSPEIARGLSDIENRLYVVRQEFVDKGLELSSKAVVKSHLGQTDSENYPLLLVYFQQCYEGFVKQGELGIITIRAYKSTLKFLSLFLEKKKLNDIEIRSIEQKFLREFDAYLLTDHTTKYKESICRNTANKHHSRLQRILNLAIMDGHIVVNPYQSFKLKTTKTTRERLSYGELAQLENFDASHNRSWSKVKDLFLFSCYTGIRFSDSQTLQYSHLNKNKNGKYYVHLVMGKTADLVIVPVIPKALSILEKYNNFEQIKPEDKLLPALTNQKFNLYIKHVAEMCGISKNLSHHIARHTFATHALNNGIPIEVVQKLLGHTDIKTTQIYAKLMEETLFKEMEKMG